MNDSDFHRPDPDELLASLTREEHKSGKGKLHIFFGMCAGVGKTFTMLKVAQQEQQKGKDIIIGYVETHNRKETALLTEGFEIIPRKKLEYKSTFVEEMDLDAILKRKPAVAVVDELAHTNLPGCRHIKRFQDVLEILENGINVYTTLNVQHLESRSETVAQITGAIVRETIPDIIFENAEEVELVDLPPDELLQRLSDGKVYTSDRSQEAIRNFFRKGNLTALREMALRIVAERVDKQLHDYMQENRIRGPWKSGLSLLVVMDHRQHSMRLLRWAKNLAYSMGATLQALYVETHIKINSRDAEQLDRNLNLARQLGIQSRIITSHDSVKAIVTYAQKENITHIIVGKPRIRNVISMFHLGNFVNRLIRYSGNIDVYILGADKQSKDFYKKKVTIPPFTSSVAQYIIACLLVVLTSLVFFLLQDYIGYQIVSFGLLFLVSILALFMGTGPIFTAAVISSLIWDYFFIPPHYTLHVQNPLDMLMLIMFFFIALLNGTLTSRVKGQEKKSRIREERTHALYRLSREMTQASNVTAVTGLALAYIEKYFRVKSQVLLKNEQGLLECSGKSSTQADLSENDYSVADWVFKHSVKAGKFTDTLPTGTYTFYPMIGNSGNAGVIAVEHSSRFTHGEEQFWEACLSQISAKFERESLRDQARKAYLLKESDKLYKTLFNSISHELRVPVTSIMGSSEALLTQDFPEETKNILLREIQMASVRLNRLIGNLLNMSRLESGFITPRPDWHDVHDLAHGLSLLLEQELSPFKWITILPKDIPLLHFDYGLTEQIIYNLVINATQHSPAGSRIRLKIFYDAGFMVIQVMDRGKGFPAEDLPLVFNKFYRGKDAGTGGTGLGLSIVKGFVEAQDGTVVAENRENGGARITVRIPAGCSTFNDETKAFT